MPRKELPKNLLASFSIWKTMLYALSLGAIFTFSSWLFKFIWEPGRYVGFNSNPPSFPPLAIGDILLGSGFWPLYLWMRWAWQPRRKHARWHRWLGKLMGAVYISVLILLAGTASWNTLLNRPWNGVVNSVLVVLLIMAWILPALSYRWSKKIARAQDTLGLRMLAFGGVGSLMVLAGVLGASLGMDASRNGEGESVLLIMAFGWPLVAVFAAQYNAERLWPYRPWQKEEEE